MINTNYVKIGQEVFFVSRIGIERCNIVAFRNKGFVNVHHNGTVNYNGELISATYGDSAVRESDLFLTLEEAIAFIKKKDSDMFNKYKNSIKNLKDLLEFPVKNSFSDGDGCQDGLIVKAYTERIYELTGIEIQI